MLFVAVRTVTFRQHIWFITVTKWECIEKNFAIIDSAMHQFDPQVFLLFSWLDYVITGIFIRFSYIIF